MTSYSMLFTNMQLPLQKHAATTARMWVYWELHDLGFFSEVSTGKPASAVQQQPPKSQISTLYPFPSHTKLN